MELKIGAELLQAILNYLSGQPFKEVVGLIQGIQQCKPVEQKAAPVVVEETSGEK